jgi:hypothetical protein
VIDLAVAARGCGRIDIFLGNGDGTFRKNQSISTVGTPNNIISADFDRDGRLDLVATNEYGRGVSILLGNGNGTFKDPIEFKIPGASSVNHATTADFNNDGLLDLAVAFDSKSISVLLCNGDGTFDFLSRKDILGAFYILAADFNGDEKFDLAVSDGLKGGIVVLLGQGDGTFNTDGKYATPGNSLAVALGDLNGDKIPDLISTNYQSARVSVLLGQGNGKFATAVNYPAGLYNRGLAVADFNNDGRLDMAVGNQGQSSISVFLQQVPVAPPHFISLPDIDGDGSPEIVAVLYDSGLQKATARVKNAKTGVLVKQIAFNGQFVPKKIGVVPDLNGNGAKEIAALGVRSSDQAVQVEIRDSLSGVKLSAVLFPATFTPISLSVVRDDSCGSKVCLAVLQQNDTALRVQLKDALTGAAIRTIGFSSGYNGRTFGTIADLNGNKKREFALLADSKSPGAASIMEIRDSKTGGLIRTISYPAGEPVRGLLNLADLNQNGGTEVASLLPHLLQVVVVDTQTGLTLSTIDTTLSKPLLLSKEIDSGSDHNVALLGVRHSDGNIGAEVYDSLTGAVVHSIVFSQIGTTVGFQRIPDVNGNGSSELVRLREQQGTPQFVAEIRDGATGVLINNIGF